MMAKHFFSWRSDAVHLLIRQDVRLFIQLFSGIIHSKRCH